jgi:hypothetical protein
MGIKLHLEMKQAKDHDYRVVVYDTIKNTLFTLDDRIRRGVGKTICEIVDFESSKRILEKKADFYVLGGYPDKTDGEAILQIAEKLQRKNGEGEVVFFHTFRDKDMQQRAERLGHVVESGHYAELIAYLNRKINPKKPDEP